LRDELAAIGYIFRSRTDSEVIANGWHAWGPRLFGRLRLLILELWFRTWIDGAAASESYRPAAIAGVLEAGAA